MKNGRVLLAALCAFALLISLVIALAPDAYAVGDDVIIAETDGATITISENDKILNLNGKKNVIVEFACNVELSVVDTAFMGANGAIDFTGNSAGSLTVKGEGKIAPVTLYNGYRYLAVNENGIYSFHPFNLTISKIGLNTNPGAICIRATFIANDVVKNLVKDYGVTNLTDGGNTSAKGRYGFDDVHGFHAYFDLKGSLDEGKLSEAKDFCAYITVGNETISSAQAVNIVPETILGWVNAGCDSYSELVWTKIQAMIARNPHLEDIPDLTNIIHRINLIADKATVADLNDYLYLYRPEHFGAAKEALLKLGFNEEDFVPKCKGYRFCWYAEENIILLVNENNCIVYPAEYIDVDVRDVRKFFDLSLPVARATIDTNPSPVDAMVGGYGIIENIERSVNYILTWKSSGSMRYEDWYVDLYLSVDLPDGMERADIALTGYHERLNHWYASYIEDFVEGEEYTVFEDINGLYPITYSDARYYVSELHCSVIANDAHPELCELAFGHSGYDDPTGTVLKTEIRLTNPEDITEYFVLGIYQYTFA